MSFLLPWLATFAFAFLLFIVGKYLQRGETKDRARRKALENARQTPLSSSAVGAMKQPAQIGQMGSYLGSQEGQPSYRIKPYN